MACGLFIRSQILEGSDDGGSLSFLFFDDNCDGSASGVGTAFPAISGDDLYVDFTGFIAGCYHLRYEAPVYEGACEYDPIDYYIEVLDSVDAGTGASLELCITDPIQNIFDALGGSPDSTGSWSGSGVASAGYIPNSSVPTDDQFDPSLMSEGDVVSFIYTINPNDPISGAAIYGCDNCDPSVAVVTYNIVACPNPCTVDAGLGNSINVCVDCGWDAFQQLNGNPDIGGVWTMITGNSSTIVGSFITVFSSGFYEFMYTVTDPGNPSCTHSSVLSVQAIVAPFAGTPILNPVEICENSDAYELILNLSGASTQGYWVGDGLPVGSFNPELGIITPEVGDGGFTGTYTYVAVITEYELIPECEAACTSSVSFDVEITALCDSGGHQSVQVCLNDATPLNLQTILGGVPISNLYFLGYDDPDFAGGYVGSAQFAINGVPNTYSTFDLIPSPHEVSLFQGVGAYLFNHFCNFGANCGFGGSVTVNVVDCAPSCQPIITIAQDVTPDGCDFTATVGVGTCPNYPATAIIQWQQLIGVTWINITGATGTTYSHTNNNAIRASLSNCGTDCDIVYSNSLQSDCSPSSSCSVVATCSPVLGNGSIDFSWVLTNGSGGVVYNISRSVTGTNCFDATGWTTLDSGTVSSPSGTINFLAGFYGGGFYRFIVQDQTEPLTCNDECCVNTIDLECKFDACVYGFSVIEEVYANGSDILTGTPPYDLDVVGDETALIADIDTWLGLNGGGATSIDNTRGVCLVIDPGSTQDFNYIVYENIFENAATLPTVKIHFDSEDCPKECNYLVDISAATEKIYQISTNSGNAISGQYDMNNSSDRANMKIEIEDYLNEKGCSGYTVNVTSSVIQILDSCIAFNYALQVPETSGGSVVYQFNQTSC